MLVSFELYAELLADQQEQSERREWLLRRSLIAAEQQRHEKDQYEAPQQASSASSVAAAGSSTEIPWPYVDPVEETPRSSTEETLASVTYAALQLQQQDIAFASARSRVTYGHAATAHTTTGAPAASVSVQHQQEAKAETHSPQRTECVTAKAVSRSSADITASKEQQQHQALLQERAGDTSAASKVPETPASTQQHAERPDTTAVAHKEEKLGSSSPQARATHADVAFQGEQQQQQAHLEQLVQAHIEQRDEELYERIQEDKCPYWCVPTDGCYTTQPVFASPAARQRAIQQQQQQLSQHLGRVIGRMPQQRVSLLEEAEGFVAQAALSAAAAELLRVQQEHLQHQAVQQELLQQRLTVKLRKVPRHLCIYAAEVTCRMFFDPQYRAKLLHEE